MLYNIARPNGMQAQVWIDKLEDSPMPIGNISSSSFNNLSNKKAFHNEVGVEMCLPRHASNYVFLGLRYEHSPSTEITIMVSENQQGKELSDRLTPPADKVYAGIPEEFSSKIVETMAVLIDNGSVPRGRYYFVQGAHAVIGSSKHMFEKACAVLIGTLTEENITQERLTELIINKLKRY